MTDDRVFLRVIQPDGQYRLYQLQPHVKLGNVSRSLKTQGSLYFGDRKILDTETPASIGLLTGLENSVDLTFVPAQPAVTETTRGDPRPDASVDIQGLLRMLRESSQVPKEAPLDAGESNKSSLSATAERYNPNVNILRSVDDSTSRDEEIARSAVPRVNRASDRPPRKQLPEQKHGDTALPHVAWPQEAYTVVPSETPSYASPKLQGTRRRDRLIEGDNSSIHVSVASEPIRAPEISLSTTTKSNLTAPITDEHVSVSVNQLVEDMQTLRTQLAEEREHRMSLERRLDALLTVLPQNVIAWSAEQEHQRLMKELRQQRKSRSCSSQD